jgi:c-di-GMP-binding flagellar brake protein YcgR
MPQTSGLTVRQHEREGLQVPVEFVVSEKHRAQVHFSPASSALGQHAIRGQAVDISSGGMGLECRHFVPRMCEGMIRVFAPDSVGYSNEGSPLYEVAFEHRAKVRRVYLISREPLYAMGLAFIDPAPEVDAQISALLKRVRQAQQSAPQKREGDSAAGGIRAAGGGG